MAERNVRWRGVSSVGRAREWHSRGRGFKSHTLHQTLGYRGRDVVKLWGMSRQAELSSNPEECQALPRVLNRLGTDSPKDA